MVDPDFWKEYEPKHVGVNLNSPETHKEILHQMMKLAVSNSLTSLEKIKKIHCVMDPFTVDNDLLTPTFKLRRNNAKKFFEQQIQQMYEEGEKFLI